MEIEEPLCYDVNSCTARWFGLYCSVLFENGNTTADQQLSLRASEEPCSVLLSRCRSRGWETEPSEVLPVGPKMKTTPESNVPLVEGDVAGRGVLCFHRLRLNGA